MADLINPETGEAIASVALPGEPSKAPKFGDMGDPHGFTCVSAVRLEAWKPSKNAPDVLRQEIGTIVFKSIQGLKTTARVIKHQTRTVTEDGRLVGKGKLELTFAQNFAKSKPSVEMSAESDEWANQVLGAWKAYRDANKYPQVLLVPPSESSAATVED